MQFLLLFSRHRFSLIQELFPTLFLQAREILADISPAHHRSCSEWRFADLLMQYYGLASRAGFLHLPSFLPACRFRSIQKSKEKVLVPPKFLFVKKLLWPQHNFRGRFDCIRQKILISDKKEKTYSPVKATQSKAPDF